MLFTSLPFFILLITIVPVYYSLKTSKQQVLLLTIGSLIFYAYKDWTLVFLLLFSSLITSILGYEVLVNQSGNEKRVTTIGVILNLSVLGIFKYGCLLVSTAQSLVHTTEDFVLMLPLPIGISFYTFQGISLMIDAYKGNLELHAVEVPPRKEYIKKSLFYVVFFPQLIAGPIVKAAHFIPQISIKYFKKINIEYVCKKLILGYFFKMVIADNLKDFTNQMDYPHFQQYSSMMLVMMLLGYSFQIFADFAGYSHIALGLAALFGYNLLENFNYPYIANSFKDFWKRWHISLSSFLMEYLYFPIGGNRKGRFRTYVNLFLTMLIGGIWHGAAWSYAVWGVLHGTFLLTERFFSDLGLKSKSIMYRSMKIIIVFLMVTFAWLTFKLPNFHDVICYVQAMFSNKGKIYSLSYIMNIVLLSCFIVIYHCRKLVIIKFRLFHKDYFYNWTYSAMLFLIVINSGSSGEFIYFQF